MEKKEKWRANFGKSDQRIPQVVQLDWDSFFFYLCLSCNVPFCSSSSSLTYTFVTPTALLATHLSLPTMEILF